MILSVQTILTRTKSRGAQVSVDHRDDNNVLEDIEPPLTCYSIIDHRDNNDDVEKEGRLHVTGLGIRKHQEQ